jgi:predicted acyl esterase
MFLSDKNDSVDLGNWLVQQEWSNGKIYTFGASADGIASFQVLSNQTIDILNVLNLIFL